jgi:hypothetical protein
MEQKRQEVSDRVVSPVTAVALGEAGNEFSLRMDGEVLENRLRLAVDGVDAQAEVVGDFLAAPTLAKEIENRAVAWIETGDCLTGLIPERR